MVLDKKWETKIFHIWTVPKNGKVQYSLLLFYKGGLVYKSTVKCVFSKCGDSDVIFLNKVSFKKEFVGREILSSRCPSPNPQSQSNH